MTDLSTLSTNLARIVAEAGKSVVRVDARRRSPASGVVFQNGVVVTTHHAIERDEGIRIGGADGRTVDAELAGRDPSTDLAVLKAPTDGLAIPTWADANTLQLGNIVLAIARAGSLAATFGIASSIDEAWRTPGGGRVDRWIESDLDLPGGFSGGLLVDAEGRALGINTTGLVRGQRIAIPTATVRRVVESLLSKGGVQRGYLGIGSHPIRLPEKLAEAYKQQNALIIVSVQPGGPAEKAGVLIGDVLVSLDGAATTDVGELVSLLEEERIGKEVVLKISRAGELRDVRVTVGSRSWS